MRSKTSVTGGFSHEQSRAEIAKNRKESILNSLVKKVSGHSLNSADAKRFIEDVLEEEIDFSNISENDLSDKFSLFERTYPSWLAYQEEIRLEQYKEFDSGNDW